MEQRRRRCHAQPQCCLGAAKEWGLGVDAVTKTLPLCRNSELQKFRNSELSGNMLGGSQNRNSGDLVGWIGDLMGMGKNWGDCFGVS